MRTVDYLPEEDEIRSRVLQEGRIPAPDVLVDDDDNTPSMIASRWVLRGARCGPDAVTLLTLLASRHPGDLYAASVMSAEGAWSWCRWSKAGDALRWACRVHVDPVVEAQIARLQCGWRPHQKRS